MEVWKGSIDLNLRCQKGKVFSVTDYLFAL